jgi:DHA1 family multidrug resistance protein-like MFS transporter
VLSILFKREYNQAKRVHHKGTKQMAALTVWRLSPKEIKILYIAVFSVNMGFFALIPYLALYLTESLMWSMALTGILLGVRQFSQQGFTFLGGILADRRGCKQTLILGLVVRSAGFAYFAFCQEIWHFFVAAVLSGFGGALFEPSLQGAFAKLSPENHRKQLFSFKNMVSNVGIICAAFLGSLLTSIDFYYLSIFAGLIYVFLALFIHNNLTVPDIEIEHQSIVQDIGEIVKNAPFIFYTFVLMGYFYLFMQLYLTVPRLAVRITGDSTSVAYIYAVVSISVICFQLYVSKLIENFPNRFIMIGLGSLIMGISLFLMGSSNGIFMLCFSAVIFAAGTMIAAPVIMDVIPLFAPPRLMASYYGFNGYSMAVGGALSTSLGGWFYDKGEHLGMPLLPWFICLTVSFIVMGCMYFLEDRSSPGLPAPSEIKQ